MAAHLIRHRAHVREYVCLTSNFCVAISHFTTSVAALHLSSLPSNYCLCDHSPWFPSLEYFLIRTWIRLPVGNTIESCRMIRAVEELVKHCAPRFSAVSALNIRFSMILYWRKRFFVEQILCLNKVSHNFATRNQVAFHTFVSSVIFLGRDKFTTLHDSKWVVWRGPQLILASTPAHHLGTPFCWC